MVPDIGTILNYVIIFGFCCLAFGPIFGPGSTAATAAPTANIDQCVQSPPLSTNQPANPNVPVVKLKQTASNSTARLVIEDPPSDLQLEYTDQAEFTDADGFTIISGEQATIAGNPDRAWVNVSAPKYERLSKPGLGNEHTLVRLPETNRQVHFEVHNRGYAGHKFALLGPHSTTNRTVGCQDITLVTPVGENVELGLAPSKIADDLATASKEISIGHRHSRLITFITPSGFGNRDGYVIPNPGTKQGGNEIVLSPNISRRDANNVVFHEYVHTAQRNLEPRWVAEGQTLYLATELAIQEGYVKPRYATYDNKHLLNSSTGRAVTSGDEEPYARGYFFFASLDRRLTSQNTSLESVIRLVNKQQLRNPRAGEIDTWESAVETKTGNSVSLTHPYKQPPEAV